MVPHDRLSKEVFASDRNLPTCIYDKTASALDGFAIVDYGDLKPLIEGTGLPIEIVLIKSAAGEIQMA